MIPEAPREGKKVELTFPVRLWLVAVVISAISHGSRAVDFVRAVAVSHYWLWYRSSVLR